MVKHLSICFVAMALASCTVANIGKTSTTLVAIGGRGSVTRPDGSKITWNNEKSFADGTAGVGKVVNSQAMRTAVTNLTTRTAEAIR